MSAPTRSLRLMALLAGGVSAFALTYSGSGMAQQAAQADQPAAAGTVGLEEIVVTARRKEEKAQTVPITLSTFAPTVIESEHLENIRDVETLTPGVTSNGTVGIPAFIWIHGVQGAPIYFDEVPILPYPGYSMGFDFTNIQVLKGPQGTLFGQSADAGAFLYTTHPTSNDFQGSVMAEVGDYGHRHLEGVVNIPVIDDKLVVRAGGLWNHTNGYVKDLTTGFETGSEDYDIGRITVTARPVDNLQNDFVFQYFDSHSVPDVVLNWYANPVSSNATLYGPGLVIGSKLQVQVGPYAVLGGTYRPGGEFSSNQTMYAVDTARWDITDDLALKNIIGIQDIEDGISNSIPAQPGLPTAWYPLTAANQLLLNGDPLVQPPIKVVYTEELQVQGRALDDKLGYTFGSFNAWVGTRQDPHGATYTAAGSAAGGSVSGALSWGRQMTNGIFAQGTYDLGAIADGLSLTLGYRYTFDRQVLTTETFKGNQALATEVTQPLQSKAPSYNMSLDYQVTSGTMVYVTNSKGYSKGGFNGGNAAFTLPQYASYLPESLQQVEIGIKSDWELFDVKARTNLSAFYGNYAKVQAIVNVLVPSPVPGVAPAFATLTQNAATAHIEGVDGELTIVPIDPLSITGQFGYVHFKYDTWINNGADWSDTIQYYTPQLQYNLHSTYHLPVLGWVAPGQELGDLSLTAAYQWEAHTSGSLIYPQSSFNEPPAWSNMDMSLDWRNVFGKDGLDGRVYVQNTLENVHLTNSGSNYTLTGSVGRTPKPPRMWGVSMRYTFGPGGETSHAAAEQTFTPPPTQAPAPPPAVARNYQVFFDFDKSDLTPQAVAIVDDAARNAGPAKVTRIDVTGHTDTSGSDEYNLRLSRRRALSVATELEKHGIPESEITIIARGKQGLLVPTADGVREPQNRRVEIVYAGM